MVAARSEATSAPNDAANDDACGEQEVACEDGDDVAPPGVHAGDPTAGFGFVDHVVVVERPEVHQLAGDSAGHCLVGRATNVTTAIVGQGTGRARVGGTQREGRTQPLPAGADQVGGDVGEERIRGPDRFAQRPVDVCEVVGQPGQVVGQIRGRGGPQRFSRPGHGPTVGSFGNNLQAGGRFTLTDRVPGADPYAEGPGARPITLNDDATIRILLTVG